MTSKDKMTALIARMPHLLQFIPVGQFLTGIDINSPLYNCIPPVIGDKTISSAT
jgi:hypothetical protein